MSENIDFVCAPVLLIAFNRPERLTAQIVRLRAVRPARLFVAVDGPRADRSEDIDAVARTREAVGLVDWPCEVKTRFLEANRGCRFAPPEAISWMLEAAGEGIILEDGRLDFPLVHPPAIAVDESADRLHAGRSAGYLPRALTVCGALMQGFRARRADKCWFITLARRAECRFPALFRI